jgi:hypothetical protein
MPFSASVHSTWHHIGRYNLSPCANPLHRAHHIPIDTDIFIDTYYLYLSAKYLDETLRLFDDVIKPSCKRSIAFENLAKSMRQLKMKEKKKTKLKET